MKSNHDDLELERPLNDRWGTIFRRALAIVATSAISLGLCGGMAGLLVGVLAPWLAIGLYSLDGPKPPPSFSPIVFGLKSGLGVGLAYGAGLGLLLAVVAISYRRLLRFRLRSLMVLIALFSIVLWAFMTKLASS